MQQKLGDIFSLPFGETKVMNHFSTAKDSVYIENTFGESANTFLLAHDTLTLAAQHGAVISNKVKVICVSGRVIEGTYAELCSIAQAIKEHCTTSKKPNFEAWHGSTEEFRIEGKITGSYNSLIHAEPLDNKMLWSFTKLWIKSLYTNLQYRIWAIEYSTKDKYAIIINSIKKI